MIFITFCCHSPRSAFSGSGRFSHSGTLHSLCCFVLLCCPPQAHPVCVFLNCSHRSASCLLPRWYGHCSPRPGVSRGGAGMGERTGTLVLGSLCATGLNGCIMQSSRHRGDVWSHNGARANIIQIFSQSKFNTRPKSWGRKGGLKKGGKSTLTYCLRLTVNVVNVK